MPSLPATSQPTTLGRSTAHFAKMSKVAKYRRQVSEDPDIDSLLSTLSPEEMEELEKELDVVDPDGSIPVGLRQRNQTDKQPSGSFNREAMLNFCEKESKKLIQREMSVDVSATREGAGWGGRAGPRAPGLEPFFFGRMLLTGGGPDASEQVIMR